MKVTPFAEYPGKGRGTGGVRCHRFLKGEDTLLLAYAGPPPVKAAAPAGRRSTSRRSTAAATAPAPRPPSRILAISGAPR